MAGYAVSRTLAPTARATLDDAVGDGGGDTLRAARDLSPEAIVALVGDSGLPRPRRRGVPAVRKWQAVIANEPAPGSASVVVNAAEGEPGSFKDRTILRTDPYRVLEGTLIAAPRSVRARSCSACVPRWDATSTASRRPSRRSPRRDGATGSSSAWSPVPTTTCSARRPRCSRRSTDVIPSTRVAPPYRRGIDEITEPGRQPHPESASASALELATPTHETDTPPTLAGNLETFANLPGIVTNGAAWFRELGSDDRAPAPSSAQ